MLAKSNASIISEKTILPHLVNQPLQVTGKWLFLSGSVDSCLLISSRRMKEGIEDRTEQTLVNLRHVLYLAIMNTSNYKEVDKLLKIEVQDVHNFFEFVA